MQLPKSLSRIATSGAGSLAEALPQRLPLIVSALLAVVIAWQAVQLGYRLLGATPAVPPSVGLQGPTGPGVPTSPVANLQAIVNAHLFGVAGASASDDPSVAPATQMPLVLVGVIAQTDPALGLAIIGESATAAKVYAVGKTINGGAKLHSVYADRVVLDRNGRLETLALPKLFKGGGLTRAVVATTPGPGLGAQIQAMASQNPASITEIIRPQPVFANGQQRGYRVYPGRNRAQFSQLGLMPGDLVTAVNGTPLDDPARGMEIFQSINSAVEATVTVERNGQVQNLTINNTQVPRPSPTVDAPAPDEETLVSGEATPLQTEPTSTE
jgi:general secretion pathway protein C